MEFPFWRYNLFYYVYVLSYYRQARDDKRFIDAIRQLGAHTNDGGEIVVDVPPRDWQGYPFARKGQPSGLATQRWQEVQRNVKT